MTFLTVTMDDDNDMTTNVGGSRGSTALPKFNHLYPILFFSQFIRFCGANKCGGPLSSPGGRMEPAVAPGDSQRAGQWVGLPPPLRFLGDRGRSPAPSPARKAPTHNYPFTYTIIHFIRRHPGRHLQCAPVHGGCQPPQAASSCGGACLHGRLPFII